jgi:hypothetical protein
MAGAKNPAPFGETGPSLTPNPRIITEDGDWVIEGGKELPEPPYFRGHKDVVEYYAALNQFDQWRGQIERHMCRNYTDECGAVLRRMMREQGVEY